MNISQFQLVAEKVLRKPLQRKAVYDVIFNGLTCYESERKHHCPPGTVYRSHAAVVAHFDHCVAVVAAK